MKMVIQVSQIKKIKKYNKEVIETFIDYLAENIVRYMKSNNVSIFSIYTNKEFIESIPFNSEIYNIISFGYYGDEGQAWYRANKNFLKSEQNDENNRNDFGKVGNYLEFTYDRIKFNLLCKYLTHNITWR